MMKFSSGWSLRSQAASFTDFSNSESLNEMCFKGLGEGMITISCLLYQLYRMIRMVNEDEEGVGRKYFLPLTGYNKYMNMKKVVQRAFSRY